MNSWTGRVPIVIAVVLGLVAGMELIRGVKEGISMPVRVDDYILAWEITFK